MRRNCSSPIFLTPSGGHSATRRKHGSFHSMSNSIRHSGAVSSPTQSGCSRSSRTCSPTPSNSPIAAASSSRCSRRALGGRRPTRSSARRKASSPSKSRTPVSESRPKSRRSFSRPSSRPTPAPAANMAAPASDWRSAASFRACWAARFSCAARPASEVHSRCTCRLLMLGHPA